MEEILRTILKNLVDNPDAVRIDMEEGDQEVSVSVRVADGDIGRVIGRSGSIANSIRIILRAMSAKLTGNKAVYFDVIEDDVPCWNPDLRG